MRQENTTREPKREKSIADTIRQGVESGLKRFLALGKTVCLFVASAFVFVLIGVTLLIVLSGGRRERERELEALSTSIITPSPSPTATPVPDDWVDPSVVTPDPSESWITRGQHSEDVIRLQTRLMELGYLDIDEPTDYFGKNTQYAVKLFQRQSGLQEDGIVGEQTLEQIESRDALKYVMKEGMEGDDISAFQRQLEELGYLDSKQITGYYGTDTVAAVTKFQHRNHLDEDGKAGELTMEAINSPDARVSYTKEKAIEEAKKKAAKAAKKAKPDSRIDKLIKIASEQVGKPYILGAEGPDSFDCSGLVYYCLRAVNVYTRRLNAAGLSRTSSWKKITSMSAMKRGDLIFFKSDDSSRVGHAAIYIGSGMMIDASSANGKVMKRSCTSAWSKRNFVCARRPIG